MKTNGVSGGCYCGAVRFSTKAAPYSQSNCHCENCRRAVGTQAIAWVRVKRSDLQFEEGAPTRYKTDTEAWRTFCGSCGTSLTYEHESTPDEIDITTASLEHPEDFKPLRDSFPEERLPWVNLVAEERR